MKSIYLILTLVFLFEFSFSEQVSSRTLNQFSLADDSNPKIIKNNLDDVWNDVAVDLLWLQSGINSKNCSISTKSYFGCVMAVETFATVLKKNLEVIPVSQLAGKKPYFSASRLALVEVPEPVITTPKEAYSFFEKVRSSLNARFLVASAEFLKAPTTDFEILLNEINQQAGQNVKPSLIVATASKFLESARDPHTSMMPTKKLEQSYQENGDSFVGIGIEFMPLDQGLMVRRIVKGSGSEKAGIQVGDIVVGIEGKLIKDPKDESIVSTLRGNENTSVRLTILREKVKFDVSVVRTKIVSPVISSNSIDFNGKAYAYIRLTNFMYNNICTEFATVIESWEKENIAGYVLDLRNNPGGNVAIAACVGGAFLGEKQVLSYFEKKTIFGSVFQPLPTQSRVVTKKPLSVLINAYSASASEIIAGAFKDYGRAYIVGQTSFGKGSYQGCQKMPSLESLTVCSTNGLFFGPSGNTNQTVGVVPHISVFINKEPSDLETYSIREAQMYLFPLEPKTMPNTPAGFWNTLQAPAQCMNKLDVVGLYNHSLPAVAYFKDFQLLNSLAALNCHGLR